MVFWQFLNNGVKNQRNFLVSVKTNERWQSAIGFWAAQVQYSGSRKASKKQEERIGPIHASL